MLKRLKPSRGETIELSVKGLDIPILLKRSPRARRFSLQVSEAKRGAMLTMPSYSSFAEADEFLSRHLDWLKERVAGLSEPVPFTDGAIVPLRGFAHTVHFAGSVRRRGVVWVEDGEDTLAAPAWPEGVAEDTDLLPKLCVSGEEDHAPRRLMDWLRRQAHHDLKDRVAFFAQQMKLEPKRIFIRDQTTRWGSCSTSGALSFSWRLILAPSFVLDYLAVHEVAHLAHMNHGPRFWKLVEKTMPDYEEAQAWLRVHGASLHRYGAEAMKPAGAASSPARSIE
ncbi:SprT family zinc-dependent metalloprotease [Methyloligella sp. 2.7D]|uniref:M48 family metallopeptidase n=1 Tax=unclassified Methyloligella TaxID=2625955 RepID=UPI00157CB4F2|nr:SprT family zinc-dependent metalloprotease [Methyloligella sp. GL2]QKP76038.1 M48 family metallopeptidase [Methyloligella sp. GL2]